MANFHTIMIIGLALAGVLNFGSAVLLFLQGDVNFLYALLSAAVLAGTYVGVKAMRINARLTAYENMEPTADSLYAPMKGQMPASQSRPAYEIYSRKEENTRETG